jgi:hypothetical protein
MPWWTPVPSGAAEISKMPAETLTETEISEKLQKVTIALSGPPGTRPIPSSTRNPDTVKVI